ncbi:TPA: hypothetical protein ACI1IR_001186 [Yersinia enterocolitica]
MTDALFIASLFLPSLHGDTELHISNSPKVIDLIDQCGNLAWLKFFVVTLAALQGRFCFIWHVPPHTLYPWLLLAGSAAIPESQITSSQ